MWTFLSGLLSYMPVLLLNVKRTSKNAAQSSNNLQPAVCRQIDLSVIPFLFVFVSLFFFCFPTVRLYLKGL